MFSVQCFVDPYLSFFSFGHCIICPSIYGFWLHFGIVWPLYYLSFLLRLLITPLVSFGHCIISPSIYGFWLHLWYLLAIVLSVLPFTASDYTFGIFWPLYYQSFHLRLLITPLISSNFSSTCKMKTIIVHISPPVTLHKLQYYHKIT
jgi:hypothetical protein